MDAKPSQAVEKANGKNAGDWCGLADQDRKRDHSAAAECGYLLSISALLWNFPRRAAVPMVG